MPRMQDPSTARQGPRSLPLALIHLTSANAVRQAVGSNPSWSTSEPRRGCPQLHVVGREVVQRASANHGSAGCSDPAPGSALLKKVRVHASHAKRRTYGEFRRNLEEVCSTLRSEETRPPMRRTYGEFRRNLEEVCSTLRFVPLVALVTVAGCNGVIERDPRGVFGGFRACDGGPAYCESRNRPWSGKL